MTSLAETKPRIRVVAAALFDAEGRVLVADRPPGRHMAGRWEFPGGKVAAAETDGAALVRELHEELGVWVQAARPFVATAHEYPDRIVDLSLWLVERWSGAPQPRDGQRLEWVRASRLGEWDLLEADRPFTLALSRLPETMANHGTAFDVRNPRSGENDYRFVAPSPAEMARIAAALRAQQLDWAARTLEQRIAVLQRWRAALLERKDAIVAALARDTGRYLISVGEFQGVLAAIDRWCALAPGLTREDEGRSQALPSITFASQLVPYGLVGVISPWNFPLTLAFIDAIPALLAGCAVFVKPSEVTPRWVEPVAEAIAAVPELAAVLAVQPGGREAGEALVGLVDVVCFTGSVMTGRLVAANAAAHFIPAFLELGGKDPIIVTATADVGRAADTVLRASCTATGQACQSLERVYVDRRIHDAFLAALAEKSRAVTINWPDPHRGILGPFIWAGQAHVVEEQIADAVAKGARLLTGGEIERHGGEWLRPTVLANVTHEMKVIQEETFGPVMPVIAYDTIDEAVALANDGIYGLSAAVLAGSLEEAEAIGRRIDAGAVSLNDGALTAVMHEAEKNSFKLSGLGGSRMGAPGYLRFFRKKALLRQTGTPATIGPLAEDNLPPTKQ